MIGAFSMRRLTFAAFLRLHWPLSRSAAARPATPATSPRTPSRSSTTARSRSPSSTTSSSTRSDLRRAEAAVPEGRNAGVRADPRPGGQVPRPARAVRGQGRRARRRRQRRRGRQADRGVQERAPQGQREEFQDELKQQGLTEDQARDIIRANLIQEAIYNKVTADVKVADKDIRSLRQEQASTARPRPDSCATCSSRTRRRRTGSTAN